MLYGQVDYFKKDKPRTRCNKAYAFGVIAETCEEVVIVYDDVAGCNRMYRDTDILGSARECYGFKYIGKLSAKDANKMIKDGSRVVRRAELKWVKK